MGDSFRDFLFKVLSPAIPGPLVDKMLLPEPLELFFRRAFTHRTFAMQEAGAQGIFNYEVLEKVGDKVLGACFQLYLFEIMGNEVHIPQVYSDMEKKLTDEVELSRITGELDFDRWIRIAADVQMTTKIKSDIFESFITAIVLSADRYIPEAPDIGFSLAKRWIFQVYNTYVRQKIDPRKATIFIDYRTQVNEVWMFNGWGEANYMTTGDSRVSRQAGIVGEAAVNLLAPNKLSFPEALRGRVIGTGYGKDIDTAREAAAKDALDRLRVDFAELKESEVEVSEFSDLALARLLRLIGDNPALRDRATQVLRTRKDTFSMFSVRKVKVSGQFYAQLRIKSTDGSWKGGEKAFSRVSFEQAIQKVFEKFVSKAG